MKMTQNMTTYNELLTLRADLKERLEHILAEGARIERELDQVEDVIEAAREEIGNEGGDEG